MRVLAIGDIHGHSAALDALLGEVQPAPNDLVITLGDYVDGGPDSAGVLDRLLRLSQTNKLIALRGNHDQLMLSARSSGVDAGMWHAIGGDSTLNCYPDASIDHIPEEHWRFLDEFCVDWHETETHIFVHAHLDPNLALPQQSKETLHWHSIRNRPCLPHQSGKTVICGHESQESGLPLDLGHTICIDTLQGGWLTCLDIGSGHVWQASENGNSTRHWASK